MKCPADEVLSVARSANVAVETALSPYAGGLRGVRFNHLRQYQVQSPSTSVLSFNRYIFPFYYQTFDLAIQSLNQLASPLTKDNSSAAVLTARELHQ